MHVTKIVTQLLSDVIHKTRVQALIPILSAIITSKQLRLTQLGRNLNTGSKERSDIRRVDRLLANTYYQNNNMQCHFHRSFRNIDLLQRFIHFFNEKARTLIQNGYGCDFICG